MQSMVSIQALKAVNLATSNEETRYYLRGVYVTVAARHSLYVATNGHIMLVHREDLGKDDPDNTLLGSWIVPSEVIAKLKTKKHDTRPATLEQNGQMLVISPADGSPGTMARPIDGTFPDWRRLCPCAVDYKKDQAHNAFDPIYIGLFGKAAAAFGYNRRSFKLHPANDYGSPCAVTFGNHRKTFGIIMPLRTHDESWNGVPAWVDADLAPTAMAAE